MVNKYGKEKPMKKAPKVTMSTPNLSKLKVKTRKVPMPKKVPKVTYKKK